MNIRFFFSNDYVAVNPDGPNVMEMALHYLDWYKNQGLELLKKTENPSKCPGENKICNNKYYKRAS